MAPYNFARIPQNHAAPRVHPVACSHSMTVQLHCAFDEVMRQLTEPRNMNSLAYQRRFLPASSLANVAGCGLN